MRRWWGVIGLVIMLCAGALAFGPDSAEPPPALANGPMWPRSAAWMAVDTTGVPEATFSHHCVSDLLGLLEPNGAVAAGPAQHWRYDWPRDASFVAPALAAAGHSEKAWMVLRFLSRVQSPDGGFEARYLLDGSGVPDDREAQGDSAGWVLWSLDETRRLAGAGVLPPDLRVMRDRSLERLIVVTRSGAQLPPASPDYWEVPERSLTLGTVAPMAAGLDAAARTLDAEGERSRATVARQAAENLRAVIAANFGPNYERYQDGGGQDAATAMLLPPFAPRADPAIQRAWREYQRLARRHAGGLAPGVGWKQDGVSWTPETALVAYTAAVNGDRDGARTWLDWIASHQTSWGSAAEKVRADGQPAGPAPLAWTAALIVLTERELSDPQPR